MNYSAVAAEIVRYFTEHKGKGHSRAVVADARSTKSIVVVASKADTNAPVMRNTARNHVVTLEDVEAGVLTREPLAGFPLVLDNGALVELLTGLTAKKAEKTKKIEKSDETKEPE